MKTINKTVANKLTVRFDKQLMDILVNDLKARKENQLLATVQLKAA